MGWGCFGLCGMVNVYESCMCECVCLCAYCMCVRVSENVCMLLVYIVIYVHIIALFSVLSQICYINF